MITIREKQIWYSLLLSIILSIGLIIQGVFFDLDFSQIERLNIGGFILTWIFVFIFILIIEKLFDLNNNEDLINLRKEIKKIKTRK
jgi:amino acid transporter